MTVRFDFSALGAGLLAAACGNFFGEGPDPSRAGPFQSGGAGGSGGSNGSGGTGNLAGNCNPDDPLPWVMGQGSRSCPDVVRCLHDQCGSSVSCFGADLRAGDFEGSRCPTYISCVAACRCEFSCLMRCAPDGTAACNGCIQSVQMCADNACPAQTEVCRRGGEGGTTGNYPTLLVSNLSNNINDIAVDDSHVYFSTNQGLAKVPKAGAATATPLGGFVGLMGIELIGDFIYLVQDSGALVRVSKDGADIETVAPATVGGGSGSIAFDEDYVFYSVGPYLRRVLRTGGTATEINQEFSSPGPMTSTLLALGTSHVFYRSHGTGQSPDLSLRMLEKVAAAGTMGTTVATGPIVAVVADSSKVYFTEAGSNGISTTLRVNALTPTNMAVSELATHTPMMGQFGQLGVALALDGTSLYYGGAPGIFVVSTTDKTSETLTTIMTPSALAIDEEYVYFNDLFGNGSIWKLEKTLD